MATFNLYNEKICLNEVSRESLIYNIVNYGSLSMERRKEQLAQLINKNNIRYYPISPDTICEVSIGDISQKHIDPIYEELSKNPNLLIIPLIFNPKISTDSLKQDFKISLNNKIKQVLSQNKLKREQAMDIFNEKIHINNKKPLSYDEIKAIEQSLPTILQTVKEEHFEKLIFALDGHDIKSNLLIITDNMNSNLSKYNYDLDNTNDCFQLFFDTLECKVIESLDYHSITIPQEYQSCLEDYNPRPSTKNSRNRMYIETNIYKPENT